ncbi:hypothetical protein RCL1_001599 [Eukaryota sp. TZLM3-RCL]
MDLSDITSIFIQSLEADLHVYFDKLDHVTREKQHWDDLKQSVQFLITNNIKSSDHLVDLGCSIYTSAKVEDTSTVFVNIGLGFLVEMLHDEAICFCTTQMEYFNKIIDDIHLEIAKIRAKLQLVKHDISTYIQGIQ